MYSIQNLLYFCKVVESRSMNSAAAELYISQSALSRAMKTLENDLHAVLLTRTSRGVRPTPAGELLYRRASGLIRELDLIANLSDPPPEPVLSVSVFPFLFTGPLFQKYFMSPARRKTRPELVECSAAEAASNVFEGRSELGLAAYSESGAREFEALAGKNRLSYAPLIKCAPMACIGPENPLYSRESASLQDLGASRLLSLSEDRLIPGAPPAGIAGSGYLALHLLRSSDFWCCASPADADAAREYGLRLISLESPAPELSIGLISRSDRALSDAAEDFFRFISDELSGIDMR